jgi:hypothetical protein
VGLILQGQTIEAMHAVLAHAERYPTDALAASTALGAYGLIAFSGRADHDRARLDFLERLAAHYPQDFAWLLTNRGWARIECGDVAEGLAMTLRAIGLRRANGHNAHHVMHGYYEARDPEAALSFIEGWLPDYPDHALMWGHLQWHAALMELALGDEEAASRRFDGADPLVPAARAAFHGARRCRFHPLANAASGNDRASLGSRPCAGRTPLREWQQCVWRDPSRDACGAAQRIARRSALRWSACGRSRRRATRAHVQRRRG